MPNDVWCIDFKGWFRTGRRHALRNPLTVNRRVQPPTLLCTRAGGAGPDYTNCRSELERGVQGIWVAGVRFRSDNGTPVRLGRSGRTESASRCGGSSSGFAPERIAPGPAPSRTGPPRAECMGRSRAETAKAARPPPPQPSRGAFESLLFAMSSITSGRTKRWARPPPAQHYQPSARQLSGAA